LVGDLNERGVSHVQSDQIDLLIVLLFGRIPFALLFDRIQYAVECVDRQRGEARLIVAD